MPVLLAAPQLLRYFSPPFEVGVDGGTIVIDLQKVGQQSLYFFVFNGHWSCNISLFELSQIVIVSQSISLESCRVESDAAD